MVKCSPLLRGCLSYGFAAHGLRLLSYGDLLHHGTPCSLPSSAHLTKSSLTSHSTALQSRGAVSAWGERSSGDKWRWFWRQIASIWCAIPLYLPNCISSEISSPWVFIWIVSSWIRELYYMGRLGNVSCIVLFLTVRLICSSFGVPEKVHIGNRNGDGDRIGSWFLGKHERRLIVESRILSWYSSRRTLSNTGLQTLLRNK